MPNEQMLSDSQVIQELQAGSERALRYVYDRYSGRIYFLAMKFLKSPEQAQELVQDVFLKLWEKRAELDKDRPIEAWLYTVAKNRVINQFKKVAREQQRRSPQAMAAELVPATDVADRRVLERETNHLLQEAINRLPEKQREVYTLARMEGYSRLEIADQLQISSLTVKTHMSRAVLSVKNFLQNKGLSAGCLLAIGQLAVGLPAFVHASFLLI
jgi:RNA polymerase sigma-70 factor (ECF subfamily)